MTASALRSAPRNSAVAKASKAPPARRVLIVASSYAPTMIADMHRARHLAWELPKLGWEVEILCPDAGYQRPSHIDQDSTAFFAPGTPIHFVPQFLPILFSTAGMTTIGWRAIAPMLRAGSRLLRNRPFDLVYISTTQFPLFLLGPAWRRRFGVPFVLDFHDPCYREGVRAPTWALPSLKYAIGGHLSKYLESRAVTGASGVIAVSPHYIETLCHRYEKSGPAWLSAARHAVIPFGVLPRDLDAAAGECAGMPPKCANRTKIVYVGAGGPIMRRSFSLLCAALSRLREQRPQLVQGVKIELYGTMTDWRDGDPRQLEDVAHERGVGDLITEHPKWISFRRSLELLRESQGALVLGVDDAGYMPSKLFSYAWSGKPLLASLRREGPAYAQFENNPGLGRALWFDQSGAMPLAEAADIVGQFLHEVGARRTFDRMNMLEPFLAAAMARRHVELFEACL
jgi:hypothetical protein